MRIWKDFRFEAAHSLPGLPEDHPCHWMHGHSYRVRVYVEGPVQPGVGFVREFSEIQEAVQPLIDKLDHSVLNDTIHSPTTEVLVGWFLRELPDWVSGVRVQETERTGAEGWR